MRKVRVAMARQVGVQVCAVAVSRFDCTAPSPAMRRRKPKSCHANIIERSPTITRGTEEWRCRPCGVVDLVKMSRLFRSKETPFPVLRDLRCKTECLGLDRVVTDGRL